MYETGERAGRLLLAILREGRRHFVRRKRLPLMSDTLRSTTLSGAMRHAVASACAAEAGGAAAVSVFAGFALADIEAPSLKKTAASGTASANSAALAPPCDPETTMAPASSPLNVLIESTIRMRRPRPRAASFFSAPRSRRARAALPPALRSTARPAAAADRRPHSPAAAARP